MDRCTKCDWRGSSCWSGQDDEEGTKVEAMAEMVAWISSECPVVELFWVGIVVHVKVGTFVRSTTTTSSMSNCSKIEDISSLLFSTRRRFIPSSSYTLLLLTTKLVLPWNYISKNKPKICFFLQIPEKKLLKVLAKSKKPYIYIIILYIYKVYIYIYIYIIVDSRYIYIYIIIYFYIIKYTVYMNIKWENESMNQSYSLCTTV